MTDLEQHVNEPGRDKLVKDVKAKIDALVLHMYIISLYQLPGVSSVRVFLHVTGRD